MNDLMLQWLIWVAGESLVCEPPNGHHLILLDFLLYSMKTHLESKLY